MGDSLNSWKDELRASLRSAEDLRREGFIPSKEVSAYQQVINRYQFWLPRYYAELIDRNDPNCPIRRQALPDVHEFQQADGFSADPLGDLAHKHSRLTHRYGNRVLLHLTTNCSMYCRYCFRKGLLNEDRTEFLHGEWQDALDYLNQHREVEEVIFSGGDPWLVGDELLRQVVSKLSELSWLKRFRWHTRVPVTFPHRVTSKLVEAIRSPLTNVVVFHFNHPKEITLQSRRVCELLKGANFRLLNQSVLLKGVNDSSRVLSLLSEKLFDLGIIPYYLHHPDKAKGTSHFWVSFNEGKKIYAQLRERQSGYLVPRYVVDDGSQKYKPTLV